MGITISPIHREFAAEVSGVDLGCPLAPEAIEEIARGMDTFAVLVFREQYLDDDQQRQFSLNFGPLEPTHGGGTTRAGKRHIGSSVEDVSNLDEDNRPLARDDRRRIFNLANQLWHSDSSFQPVPPKYSVLSGRIVVENGGCTEVADMRAGYDALDPCSKAEIEHLTCEHSWIYSRAQLGLTEVSEIERAAFAPVRQALVRTHPITKRKALFLSSHIGTISGWAVPEARMFIRHLTEQALAAGPIYRHIWRRHDVLMWDNRTTMHRVTPFDTRQVRDMRRTTVAGDAD